MQCRIEVRTFYSNGRWNVFGSGRGVEWWFEVEDDGFEGECGGVGFAGAEGYEWVSGVIAYSLAYSYDGV